MAACDVGAMCVGGQPYEGDVPVVALQASGGASGKKRALLALGHTLLGIVYAVLKKRTTYRELGADYLDRHDREGLKTRLLRRLAKLASR